MSVVGFTRSAGYSRLHKSKPGRRSESLPVGIDRFSTHLPSFAYRRLEIWMVFVVPEACPGSAEDFPKYDNGIRHGGSTGGQCTDDQEPGERANHYGFTSRTLSGHHQQRQAYFHTYELTMESPRCQHHMSGELCGRARVSAVPIGIHAKCTHESTQTNSHIALRIPIN
ncbi:hypothetical protein CC79DRAFT_1047960 [Sarocladium strictum]